MIKGGKNFPEYSGSFLRFIEISFPIFMVAYGFLIDFSIIASAKKTDSIAFYLFVLWWTCIFVTSILLPSKTRREYKLRLIAYHLLAGPYLIFVSSIASPFIICWFLLMIASYMRFHINGLRASTLSFIPLVIFDIVLWGGSNQAILINDLIALVSVLTVGIIAISICQNRDVSKEELERSKALETFQRDRVLTIINNMSDAVISVDNNGKVTIYNAAAMSLLDTNDDLSGKNINKLLKVTNQESQKISILNELKNAKTVINRDDLNFTYGDGEQIRLEMTYSPVRSNYSRSHKAEIHDGYVLMMRDITKAKSLEEERDEFISVTSHELRTPITIAEGTLSNLQIMLDRPDTKHELVKNSVNTAHEQIIFLANMVNDLSTLSRAERGVADETEIIDVRELAHKIYDKYLADAKKKNLHLDLDLSPTLEKVNASRLYLEELLQNFMTNAIKYSREGSVKIMFSQKNDMITFAVKDTGIGISKSDRQKVFHKFFRSEDYRTRESGGTGLGLYIAAKLSRKLGTQIQLVSRLNFGSTFSFMLPVYKNKKPTSVDTNA